MRKIVLTLMIVIMSIFSTTARNSYIFLADGFDEIEVSATVNTLRKSDMKITTVSTMDTTYQVVGSTGVIMFADSLLTEINSNNAEWIIIPGGIDCVKYLHEHVLMNKLISKHVKKKGKIAAIGEAPAVVLAPLHVLDDKSCTCHPSFKNDIIINPTIDYVSSSVVVDGNVITSESSATSLPFSYEIVTHSRLYTRK